MGFDFIWSAGTTVTGAAFGWGVDSEFWKINSKLIIDTIIITYLKNPSNLSLNNNTSKVYRLF